MAIEEFSRPGEDRAYLEWLEAHPAGYVLNTGRGGVRYTRLHLASCTGIQKLAGRGTTFTGGQWIKFCSPSIAELDEWSLRYKGTAGQRCGTCQPPAAR
jgi:hypothetical protein